MKSKIIEFSDENYLKGYEYETLMNALHVSVFKCLLNEDFTAIWCNNYFFESTGYTKEEYISLYQYNIRQYFASMADEYNQIATIVIEAFQQGLPGFECVSRMPHKNGSFIWIKVVGTFTNEQYDGFPVLYVVYTDITDVIEQQELSKRLEERSEMLRIALEEAEEANNAKSDFLSRMSHDIRTPLNAIIGMTKIAENHLDDPEKIHDCHQKIALSSQHLLGLINDVLDMSKIESGKMTINNSEVFLPSLIGNIIDIMQPNFKAKKQSFKIYSHNLQHEIIFTDALRLHQIFLNILSNASKFTPEGGQIIFDIQELHQNDEDALIQFSFTDTGIGIRPEFIDHIFDTFTREQDSRVDKTIGSGLGMAITKRIVGLLGGDIQVTSQMAIGTTFKVTIPFKISTSPLLLEEKLSDLHILFIDDDLKDCQCATGIFESLHIQADCVNNKKRIIQMYHQQENYDVILFNWKIKDIIFDSDIQKIIMSNHKHQPILIAMTDENENINQEAKTFNISHFIKTPLFRSTLYDGIQKCVFHNHQDLEDIKKEKNFDFHGKRFLLAEDNELNREIAIELLSSTGAQIDYASNGLECVEMFNQSPLYYYDLILMDIQMPIMNGYTATKNIRNLKRKDAKEIQIWAMTADAFVEDVEKAKAIGMNGHFAKPLDILAINTEISHFLF